MKHNILPICVLEAFWSQIMEKLFPSAQTVHSVHHAAATQESFFPPWRGELDVWI